MRSGIRLTLRLTLPSFEDARNLAVETLNALNAASSFVGEIRMDKGIYTKLNHRGRRKMRQNRVRLRIRGYGYYEG